MGVCSCAEDGPDKSGEIEHKIVVQNNRDSKFEKEANDSTQKRKQIKRMKSEIANISSH